MEDLRRIREKRDASLSRFRRQSCFHLSTEELVTLALGAPLLADVAEDRGEVHRRPEPDLRDGCLGREELAALAPSPDLSTLAHAPVVVRRLSKCVEMFTMTSAGRLRKEQVERSTEDLRAFIPEDLLGRGVEQGDAILVVDRDDRIAGQRDDAAQLALRVRGPAPHRAARRCHIWRTEVERERATGGGLVHGALSRVLVRIARVPRTSDVTRSLVNVVPWRRVCPVPSGDASRRCLSVIH